MAKFNKNGQIITTQKGILDLYEEEYKTRLCPPEPHFGYEELQSMKKYKKYLFMLRMKLAKNEQTPKWTVEQIRTICKSLKNNKAQDREGLIYELFKNGNCGNDVYTSLTKMFNGIKTSLLIPTFLQSMSITRIWKHKGSRHQLSNERGLFCLSKVRSCLDKLLYNDVYDDIDSNLSSCNAGGRRGRSIRDQLFIIYGIINDVTNGKGEDIDIMSYDVMMCYDKLDY